MNVVRKLIKDNKLTHFPHEKYPLKELTLEPITHLELYCDRLEEITSEIHRFEDLLSIEVISSKMNQFPKVFYEINNLETLRIKNALLTSIPSGISKLKKLKTLMILSTQLESLADDLHEVFTLETLNLTGNNLKELPKLPPFLKRIILDGNSFEKVPLNLREFNLLKKFSILDNPLSPAEKEKLQRYFSLPLDE